MRRPPAATPIRRLPVITGAVELDLPSLPSARRRLEVASLSGLPPCTRVVLRVGHIGPWDEPDVVSFVAEAAVKRSLTVDVRADDGRVLGAWVDAVRDTVHHLLFTVTPSGHVTTPPDQPPHDPWAGAS